MKTDGEKSRISWQNMDVVKCFLETSIEEVTKFGRIGGSLKPESWRKIREILKKNHNFEAGQKQMKNHYDYLKEKYKHLLLIIQRGSKVYDPAANVIHMTHQEWAEHLKVYPKAKSLRTSSLPFPDLCKALFDDVVSTDVNSVGTSSTVPKHASSCSLTTSNKELIAIEDTTETSQDDGSSSPSTPSTQSNGPRLNSDVERVAAPDPAEEERPRKRGKKLASLEEDMTKALKLITKKNEAPSVEDCVKKLEKLGWDKKGPLYVIALGIFCESESYRECWMLMNEKNNDLMEGWVKLIGRKLGFEF